MVLEAILARIEHYLVRSLFFVLLAELLSRRSHRLIAPRPVQVLTRKLASASSESSDGARELVAGLQIVGGGVKRYVLASCIPLDGSA